MWIAALLALAGILAGTGRAQDTQRVVLIGVPGLMWSDLSATGTPTLWQLTGKSAGAALSTRTTTVNTCPVDGWLTVSAGQRAHLAHGNCALPAEPTGAGNGQSAYEPGWAEIRKDNAHTSYQAQIGLLGEAVRRSADCTMAVGPGAVFGAADSGGRVDHYYSSISKVTDWGRCGFTAVEVDDVFRAFMTAGVDSRGAQVPVSPKTRAQAAQAADEKVAQVLAALPQDTTVLIAGLSDATKTPHLHVALRTGQSGYLTASSTRQPGLVTLTDVTATVLDSLDLDQPAKAIGSPWHTTPSGDSAQAKISALADQDVAAQAIARLGGSFFIVLFAVELVLYGVATVAVRRRRALRPTRVLALAVAAAPVATFLTNLVPWWRASSPGSALLACVAGFAAAITALALSRWRSVLIPGLVVAGLSATVLGLDVITGSRLQLNSFMGYSALVGGRFYGFGNMAFAVFATGALLSAAWLARTAARGDRRIALGVVAVAGLAAMALDGSPTWGADFGGVLAIVVSFAVLGMQISGRRISVVKIALFGLAGLAAVLVIAFADSLRPTSQETHLGKFWDQLQSGDAFGTITRKFGAMLASLGYWQFTVVTIGAAVFLFAVLWPRVKGPALTAVLTLTVLGMIMNDSGVEIPALAFTVAVPLLLAARLRELERGADDAPPAPAPQEPQAAPRA